MMLRRGIFGGVAAKAATSTYNVVRPTSIVARTLSLQVTRRSLLEDSITHHQFHQTGCQITSSSIAVSTSCTISSDGHHCSPHLRQREKDRKILNVGDIQRRPKSTLTSSSTQTTNSSSTASTKLMDKMKEPTSSITATATGAGVEETKTAQIEEEAEITRDTACEYEVPKDDGRSGGLFRLLTEQEREILVEQRELTKLARGLATDVLGTHAANNTKPSSTNDRQIIDPFPSTSLLSDLQLDSTFAIVVAGEFNAGKSTLINALLGKKVLESGAIPTTDSITILAGSSGASEHGNDVDDSNSCAGVACESSAQGQATDSSTSMKPSRTSNIDINANDAVSTSTIPILAHGLPSSSAVEAASSSTSMSLSATTRPPPPPLGVVLHIISDQPILDDLTIIDTPGTNAPEWMDHTHRTLKLLPAADLILFVTSADRPMTQSEQTLMEQIQTLYKKPILVVINKMDILNAAGGDHGSKHKQQVVDFVMQNASHVNSAGSNSGGLVPQQALVIPVSAKDALSAKLMAGSRSGSGNIIDDDGASVVKLNQHTLSNVWIRSNFDALERYLKENLTSKTRIKSKLVNPLGVIDGVMEQCLESLRQQNKELQDDISTLNLVQRQWDTWKEQLDSELQLFQHDMKDLLDHESQRVHTFISSKASDAASHHSNRVNRSWIDLYYWTLLPSNYPARLLQEWNATNHPIMFGHSRSTDSRNDDGASGDRAARRLSRTNSGSNGKGGYNNLEAELLSLVEETADAIATRGRAHGQSVIEFLGTRPAQKHQSLVGSVTAASRFEDTRDVLTNRWNDAVHSILAEATGPGGVREFTEALPDDDVPPRKEINSQSASSQKLRNEDMNVLESLRQTAMLASMFHAGSTAILLGMVAPMITSTSAIVDPIYSFLALATSLGMGSLVHAQGTSRLAKRHEEEWKRRASRLEEAISVIGRRELARVERRILQGVAPYTRYVENEQKRIQQATESCEGVLVASRQLRNRIQKL